MKQKILPPPEPPVVGEMPAIGPTEDLWDYYLPKTKETWENDYIHLDPEDREWAQVDDLESYVAQQARDDPNTFIEYVMEDEQTRKQLTQADCHVEWQHLMSIHNRLCIMAPIEHGKTNQIVGRVLWELGKNPNIRVIICSRTNKQSKRIMSLLKQYLEDEQGPGLRLRRVFPDLRKSSRDGDPWSNVEITIKRPNILKEPSVQVVSLGSSIAGARCDLAIMDDVIKMEDTYSAGGLGMAWAAYQSKIESRMGKTGRVIFIGTPFHKHDVLAKIRTMAEEGRGWAFYSYPAISQDMRPETILWPERWDMERIAHKRKITEPGEFARQFLLIPIDIENSPFKDEYIKRCLARGADVDLLTSLDPKDVPEGAMVVCGVDLGIKTKKTSDLSVFFVALIYENGDRQPLCLRASNKWSGPKKIQIMKDLHERFNCIFIVETTGAQWLMLEFTEDQTDIPIIPFNTGRNKRSTDTGLEAMSIRFYNGKWIIPNDNGVVHPEIRAWLDEMVWYERGAHTGDRLMASWFVDNAPRLLRGNYAEISVHELGEASELDDTPEIEDTTPDEYYHEQGDDDGPEIQQ